MMETIRSAQVDQAICRTLQYFGIFRYPLRAEEVRSNCSLELEQVVVDAALRWIVEEGKAFEFGGYYSPDAAVQEYVERRLAANALAEEKMKGAIRTGRFIAAFPFVRFVGISGSLSKGYANERSDYDYFIVTAGERLWICRTILHLFKKLTFLTGAQHRFCMNYFIDEEHLELEEQNLFTAIELSTLVPVAGEHVYCRLREENAYWVKEQLPNPYKAFYLTSENHMTGSKLQRLTENLIRPFAVGLNYRLMQFTNWHWRRKWRRRKYPESDYPLAFKTTLYHSKNHPENYQKKILSQLNTQNDYLSS